MTDQTDDLESATPADAEDDARTALWAELEAEDAGKPTDDDDDHDDDGHDDTGGDPDDDQQGDGPDDGDDDDPDGDATGEDDDEGDTAPAEGETQEQKIARLEKALSSERGRARGQQRASEAARKEIERLTAQIAEADKSASLSKRDEAAQAKRRERLAEAQEEYGDVIGPLAEIVAELDQRQRELTDRERQELNVKRARLDELYEREEAAFMREHPDGFDVLKQHADAFNGWIEDQPKALRDAYAANAADITNGIQAAHLVALFKQNLADAGDPQDADDPKKTDRLTSRRASQLQGSRTTRSTAATRPSATPGPDASREQAWDYWDRVEKRKAGRG